MKQRTIAMLAALALLTACASMDNTVYGADNPSLNEAIEQSAEKIAAGLPAGSRVAFAAWESPSTGLSDYIMEELTGALVDRNIEVADRQNLEYVYKELNLQMSGDVSDESAKSIGKFLGADLVITGQFTELGGPWRYRASAIQVEKATRDSVTRLSVRGDAALRRMVSALADQKTAVKASSYGVNEKTQPKTAGTFLDRGIMFAMRSDYELAIADFTEAIALNSELSSAYILRGRAYYASVSYVTSVDDNFSGVSTISAGGKATAAQQQVYDKAIADYNQVIRLDPNDAAAYVSRGNAYGDKGDNDKAIADYNQAIRLAPNYAAYTNRGIAYDNKGDYDKAIADYNQAIRLAPNHAAAYNNRGNAYKEKGDYDKAIADYTQAIRLDPNHAVIYNNRGRAYTNKRDYDKAIADYTQAIRLDPNYVDAYTNRGIAYDNKGDYVRARADWTKVLQIDPNDVWASGFLDMLGAQGR